MRVIVTCGPSCEPIDQVRFLSNFSTGELGSLLALALQQHDFEVVCLRSRLAIYPMPKNVEVIPFSTNEELAKLFEELVAKEQVKAVFHAAALCDYRVKELSALSGAVLDLQKIPTSIGPLNLRLEPSFKVISQLRSWFPEALLVGWKYEVSGTREDASFKAQQQLKKYGLNAVVANGPAVGDVFEVMFEDQLQNTSSSKSALVRFLATWLRDTLSQKSL